MQIDLRPGTLKYRTGNYVVYDIDYLLEHQNMELELLKKYRDRKKIAKPVKWEAVIDEIKAICERG